LLAAAPLAAQGENRSEGKGLPGAEAQLLAEILRNPETRDAFIAELERLGQGEGKATDQGTETEKDVSAKAPATTGKPIPHALAPVPIVIKIAEISQSFAETAAERAALLWQLLLAAPSRFSALSQLEPEVIAKALWNLGLAIIGTLSVLIALRLASNRFDLYLGGITSGSGLIKTLLLVSLSILGGVLSVVLAWAAGYLMTLMVFGQFGSIGIRQSLYLNAFLVVELIRLAFRTLLSPNSVSLRLLPIPDHAARMLYLWLGAVLTIIGYGTLVVEPIFRQDIGFFAGRSASALLVLIGLVILTALALSNRRRVADWLCESLQATEHRTAGFILRRWNLPLLLYLAFLFAIVVTRPGNLLITVLIATAEIVAAVLVGTIIMRGLKKSVRRGLRLPPPITQRLPALEDRLNVFVPKLLVLVRLLIFVVVLGFIVHTVDLIDVRILLSSQFGVKVASHIISVSVIVIMNFILWLVVASWVDYRLNPEFGSVPTAREKTLLTLLRNAFTIVSIVFTIMFSLSEIGIDIAPLIASAGVFGLAIGFGAQKLVQDIITGIFIQFENAIDVGDVVTVGGTTGTAERLTIRSVSLRDLNGVFHIVPFSSVDMVSNFMRGFSYHVAEMGIAYRESVDEAKQAMHDAFDQLKDLPEWKYEILGPLEWFGLVSFGDSAVVLRARIKCRPGNQWAIGRAYNEIIKRIFDERGIEIPFPHQTVYFGEDKEGKAPPAHIALRQEPTPVRSARKDSDKDQNRLDSSPPQALDIEQSQER